MNDIINRLYVSRAFWGFLVLTLVTLPLLYLASHPIRLVEVYFQPTQSADIALTRTYVPTRSDGRKAFVNVYGETNDPTIGELNWEIQPEKHPTFIFAGSSKVSEGTLRGVIQLGSDEWPLKADERYTFRLARPDGRVVLDGQILANVTTLAGGDQLAIVVIGLLASAIQIIEAAVRWLLKRHIGNLALS